MTITAFDPKRPDFTPYGFTCKRWLASRTPRPDRHNEIEFNLLESGSLTSLVGGRRVRLEAGRLHVFWAAMPHQIIDQEGVESFLVATIPLVWMLQWQLPGKLMQPLLNGEVLRSDEPASSQEDVMMLSRWIDYMEDPTKHLQQIILLEIQARLLRLAFSGSLALQSNSARRRSANRAELSKAEQLAGFVAQHCTQRLNALEMGRAVGLHPNYAMNLFRKTFGTTLNDYLTRQRISHAQRLLVTGNDKVTNIAFSSGFASISRFNAAFREICECSPSEYRLRTRVTA